MRNIKLLCLDLDGVIFQPRDFWEELHKLYGTAEDNKILVKKSLRNDFAKLVEEVVEKRWKGKPAKPYYDLAERIPYVPGVKEFFKEIRKKQMVTAIISGSSMELARRAQYDLGIDHIYANTLVMKNGKVSGEFIWPVGPGFEKKAEIMEHLSEDLGISLEEAAMVGDHLNDLEAFKVVGTSIAFNCHITELRRIATHVVEGNDLRKVLEIIF